MAYSPAEDTKHGRWTADEDEGLKQAVKYYGEKQWRLISEQVTGRTPIQCLHRWSKILKPGLVKGLWTALEDKALAQWVEREGPTRWSQCAQNISGRSGKQCRERWYNVLNPNVKKGEWTQEEDNLIFDLYERFGSRWTQIAANLPGRPENSVKNRFYSTIRKMKTQNATQIWGIKIEESKEDKMASLVSKVKKLESMLDKTIQEIVDIEYSLIAEKQE